MFSTLTFNDWFANVHPLDWLALAIFLAAVIGYRIFLALMLKSKPGELYLGKLQAYRNAWMKAHSGGEGQGHLVVVQTLRNNIMTASFLASTAVLLIMGAVNMLDNLDSMGKTLILFHNHAPINPSVNLIKVLLIIITLSYSFFNFSNYIREVNYMSLILNIPKQELDAIEGGDSSKLVAQAFLSSGIHFSMGMRGYYFLIPLFLWIFNPVLMILSVALIVGNLMRRDLTG